MFSILTSKIHPFHRICYFCRFLMQIWQYMLQSLLTFTSIDLYLVLLVNNFLVHSLTHKVISFPHKPFPSLVNTSKIVVIFILEFLYNLGYFFAKVISPFYVSFQNFVLVLLPKQHIMFYRTIFAQVQYPIFSSNLSTILIQILNEYFCLSLFNPHI